MIVGVAARPYVHGLSFVVRAADMQGVLRRAADLDAESIRERELAFIIEQPDGCRIPGTVRSRSRNFDAETEQQICIVTLECLQEREEHET